MESITLLFKELSKRIFFWVAFIFLLLAIYKSTIKQHLSPEYQKEIHMSVELALIIAIFSILLASIRTYHKLRIKKINELYEYSDEVRKNKIFRIFYDLYKDGKLERNADTKRRQKWDENLLVEIKKHCKKEFLWLYLDYTGRRNQTDTPILDDDFDKALCKLEDFLEKDFNIFVKV
jgi:hypothetical protein